jgi:glycosyltransferase involved in cell wall biosynthesis
VIVCMMNDNFYRSSGAAKGIRRIAQSLPKTECVFAGTGDRCPEDLSWIPSDRYRRFHLKTVNVFRLFVELLRFKQWFRRNQCDLVHCHHRRLAVLMHLMHIPVVYTGVLTFPESAWFRWLHPRHMTALTPAVAQNILETTGTRVRAVIGYPLPFPEQPPEISMPAVRNRVICIARLEPVKGHRYLLDAWKMICTQGLSKELLLVGEGSLRQELEAQAARYEISHLVRFCGFSENIFDLLDTCLFAILFSAAEGQAHVVLEAASRGRATLLTAVSGSVDLLPPGIKLRNGLNFGDVGQLAIVLREWLTAPEKVLEDGRKFFDFLKRGSQSDGVGEEYERVYDFVRREHVGPWLRQ